MSDFKEWNTRGELILQPKFQRRRVWSEKARSYLVDTILRELPIPLIFIRQQIDLKKRATVREVVDGQQRIHAVLDFLEDDLTVHRAHNPHYSGVPFSALPESVQMGFLRFEFSVVILTGASDADVLTIFARLNSYSQKLKPQELLNAEFFGPFKTTAYDLGKKHLEFWRQNGILTNRQILRMTEAELVSELMVAMIDGLQDKKKSLRRFYKEYDEGFPQEDLVREEFEHVIDKIAELTRGKLTIRAFRRKALFYSLFCVFYDALYGLPKSPTNPDGRRYELPASQRKEILGGLSRLSEQLYSEQPDPSYEPFISASSAQTDNIRPRAVRHRFIWREIAPSFHPKTG